MRYRHWAAAILVCFCVCGVAAADAVQVPGAVKAWEGTVTIPTYPWQPDDVNPRFAELDGSIIYPYTMQDSLSTKKVDRTYKALFLENEYLKVTCLPELGGRIHSVFDKTRNEEMFHLNHVIKPGLIAMRGAWISGGIEWNSGPHGHTVNIVAPTDAVFQTDRDGSARLVIGNTDQILGTRWTVWLTLRPGKAYLEEKIRLSNPTDGYHPYYFWNNTAFPCLKGTRYMYPMTLGMDHSGTTFFEWPVDKGRDMTWLKNYPDMSSIFAYKCVYDFFGAYDVDLDRGIVQYANHGILPGKKAWTWGQADFGLVSQESLTDEDGPYIEVQTGPLPTQSDYEFLAPRQQVAWEEWWMPVHGLGDGFEYATKDVVIQTKRADNVFEVRLLGTSVFERCMCIVEKVGKDGEPAKILAQESIRLSPNEPAVVKVPLFDGPAFINLLDGGGREMLAYTSPLPIPKETAPTFPPAKTEDQMTAEEAFVKAARFDKDTNRADARAWYEKTLAKDPNYFPALRALAVLDLESGRYDAAGQNLDKALARRVDDSMSWALLGLVRLHQAHVDEAREYGYKAVRLIDAAGLGYDIVGRAAAWGCDYAAAAKAFEGAVAANPQDFRSKDHLMLALWAQGEHNRAGDLASERSEEDPLAPIPRLINALNLPTSPGLSDVPGFVRQAKPVLGEYNYEMMDTANILLDLGMNDLAKSLLETAFEGKSPIALYHLAYLQSKDEAASKALLDQAKALPTDYVFPSFVSTVDALQYALSKDPNDSRAHLYLANLLAGLGRLDEAIPHWEKAAELDPKLSVAFRCLAMNAWKKQNDLNKAEALFAKAIAARPDDEGLYRDRAQLLINLGKRPEAIKLLETRPAVERPRADAAILLARAYIDEKRYDDALTLLDKATFSNWEGQSDSWDLFNRARVERGKLSFEAKDYQKALDDFSAALTYPKNLKVGRPVKPREAEAQYWKGRALQALGRLDEARAAWKEGAEGPESTDIQNKHRQLCAQAQELLSTP
jgi:tetratricopeptide (TPR) repeat protein